MFCFVDGIYVLAFEIERDAIDSFVNDVLICGRLRFGEEGRRLEIARRRLRCTFRF